MPSCRDSTPHLTINSISQSDAYRPAPNLDISLHLLALRFGKAPSPLRSAGASNYLQPRFDRKVRHEILARRDLLNSFLVLKGALLVMIGQAPAWLDTKKRPAIGPQG